MAKRKPNGRLAPPTPAPKPAPAPAQTSAPDVPQGAMLLLPAIVRDGILQYLDTQPHGQVRGMIDILSQLRPATPAEQGGQA